MSAVVWLALFVPGYRLNDSPASVSFLPTVVLLLGGTALFTQASPWETRRPARQAVAFFFLLALLDALSYTYSLAFNGVRTGPWDMIALARPLVAGVHRLSHLPLRRVGPKVPGVGTDDRDLFHPFFLRSLGAVLVPVRARPIHRATSRRWRRSTSCFFARALRRVCWRPPCWWSCSACRRASRPPAKP